MQQAGKNVLLFHFLTQGCTSAIPLQLVCMNESRQRVKHSYSHELFPGRTHRSFAYGENMKACAKEIVLSPLRWGEVRGFVQGHRECWLPLWLVPSYLAEFQCCLLCFGNAPVMMGRLAIVIGQVPKLPCKICVLKGEWSGVGRGGGEQKRMKGVLYELEVFLVSSNTNSKCFRNRK